MEGNWTEDQLKIVISLEDEWYKTGSRLYIIASKLDDEPEAFDFSKIVVGGIIDDDPDDRFTIEMNVKDQAAMLFAMAVEAWMKGLLIETFAPGIRNEEYGKYARDITDKSIEPDSAEGSRLGELFWDTYFDRVATKIKEHMNHDLRRLAKECGVSKFLNEDDLKFVGHLSSAITRGRYPADLKPIRMEVASHDLSNVITWTRIQRAILQRYRELNPKA